MNWSRWLALSVCYILVVMSVMGLDAFRPLIKPSPIYELEFSGGTVRSIDTSKTRDSLVQDVSQAWRAAAAALVKAGKHAEADEIITNLAKKSDEVISTLAANNKSRGEDASKVLAIAVLPPALLAIVVLAASAGSSRRVKGEQNHKVEEAFARTPVQEKGHRLGIFITIVAALVFVFGLGVESNPIAGLGFMGVLFGYWLARLWYWFRSA
jgi:hypothetical protein